MYGIDISTHQKKINLEVGKYDFCIIKATEGCGYTDPQYHSYAIQLTKLNKPIGCYHFARPDLHGTVKKMEEEADWFIQKVVEENLLYKAILVLDWEREPMDREDLVEAWCKRVEEKTGVTPFIYGSRSKLTKWKNWKIMNHCPIWMAAWPSIKRYEAGMDPGLPLPSKSINWNIWQYSSTGIYPEFNGNVDLDYAELTIEQWEQLAGKKEADHEEVITDDMQWAIDMGLFAGYGNGLYGPKDPLTREQAASVLRRYTDIFIV